MRPLGSLRRSRTRSVVRWLTLATVWAPTLVAGAPIAVRHPEGASRGFVNLSSMSGTVLAHGELIQWREKHVIASRLVFRFDDGSLYDETVRFTQDKVFRLQSYALEQHGPSFTESSTIEFDRSGTYRVHRKAGPDQKEERVSGTTDIPDDVTNGMTSILLKNLMPDASATTHLLAFTPDPVKLDLHLTPQGDDPYWVGTEQESARRYQVTPAVPGIKGVFATLIGKQPPTVHMWIAHGKAPLLVRFEGALYAEGPPWRIELGAPRWEKR
jgi:hypothetical protein